MWLKRRVNFDCAAGITGNPSSPHEEGRHAKKILEDARIIIARLIEVQSDDVIFTSGATEANALAILGIVQAGDHALYLPSSHSSIAENFKFLRERGAVIEELPIKNFRVDCEKLNEMLLQETKLISMDAVCGETGIVWNTREVAEVLRDKKIFLHVDASQTPLTEKISRAHFEADILTFDSSKVGATRGIGALIAHRTIPLIPLYKGGNQESGLRPGSESYELARNFARDLSAAALNRKNFRASAEKERKQLVDFIFKNISNVKVNESRLQAPHILNLSLLNRDTDYLVMLLNEAGFAVSTRSACETDSEDGSRAVFALTGDKERAKSTLRISWNSTIRHGDFIRFQKALVDAITFLDSKDCR